MTKQELLDLIEQAMLMAQMEEDILSYINLETGEVVMDPESPYADDPAMCDDPEGLRKDLAENPEKYLELPYVIGSWRWFPGSLEEKARKWYEENKDELMPLFEKKKVKHDNAD